MPVSVIIYQLNGLFLFTVQDVWFGSNTEKGRESFISLHCPSVIKVYKAFYAIFITLNK